MAKGKSKAKSSKSAKKQDDGYSDGGAESTIGGGGNEEWGMNFEEPRVDFIAPEQQLQLNDEALSSLAEPIMLRCSNPNLPNNLQKFSFQQRTFVEEPPLQFQELTTHTAITGVKLSEGSALATAQTTWLRSELDKKLEGIRKQEEETGEDGELIGVKEITKNQFNYSDRAAQTFNNPIKVRGVATKPPELKPYQDSVTQWSIYDLYLAKFNESVKDMEMLSANAKGSKHSHDISSRSGDADDDGSGNKAPKDEDIVHSEDMGKALKILERMVNQNAEAEIYEDFKYWEDQSDQFREGEGSLLPLWRFSHDRARRKQVTALAWNPALPDLFAVGYGSYEFMRQGSGLICCYSLKNTSAPEYTFSTESGVMCLDFHPQVARCALLAVGCYDGTVMVFDVRNKVNKPIYYSTIKTGKHTDPVWQVRWQEEDIAKELGFFSISTDGRVANWIMSKNELKMETVMQLKLITPEREEPDEETSLTGLAGGCCFDFNSKSEHLFIVGTEEGKIHKCSKAYSGQYLETYEGHHMAVYAVKWNPFHPRVFLSCSADWTVKLWDHSVPYPIMSFDLGNSVGDICWAPYSSTVFAAVTNDGKVHVFDLAENKHEPLCEQKVAKRAKLTHVVFNNNWPLLLVGDDRGGVNSLKLSPNLRKVNPEEDMIEKLSKMLATADTPNQQQANGPVTA